MRIALGQINTTIGAVESNARRVLDGAREAGGRGAELIVFPELTLTGYPPKDLLDYPDFIELNLRALDDIAEKSRAESLPGMIVGYVEPRETGDGKRLHNASALIDKGQVLSRHYKSLLPTYDVFDEERHFEPAPGVRLAEFRGDRLGMTICEDLWNDREFFPRRLYTADPVETITALHPELLINISASPYFQGKPKVRCEMLSALTRRHATPLVYVNQVGANDDIIFDGRSGIWGVNGKILAQAAAFEEQILVTDLNLDAAGHNCYEEMPLDEEIHRALVLGVRDYVFKCGFKRVVLGLSGGIDSALTAVIAVDALGAEAVVGVAMPSQFSSQHSIDDASQLAKNLGIEFLQIPIRNPYESFIETLAPMFQGLPFGLAEENLQARIRGIILMALSNKFGWLVLSTGNKSELATGYCTLYGDMCGGLAVLSDVLKTRVFSLSKWINRDAERIPVSTIEKPPSAELRPDQLDSDSLPPYEILDPIIEAFVEQFLPFDQIAAKGYDPALVRRVIDMIELNEYKRWQAAVGLKVSSKAFGPGRRMPIAKGRWKL